MGEALTFLLVKEGNGWRSLLPLPPTTTNPNNTTLANFFFSGLYMDVVLVITNLLHIVLFSENLLLLLPFCFIFNEALTFKFGQGVLNNSNTKATAAEGVPGRERRP